jgi:hypothetical protein
MNYEDKTLVQLADSATRAAVFDQDSLAQVLSAAYDTELLSVEGPFRPVFDEFRLGIIAAHSGQLEGTWQQAGRAEITEARFRLSGAGGGPVTRVDAFWRGAVVANASPEEARIVSASTAWSNVGMTTTDFQDAVTVAFSPPGNAPPEPVTFPLAAAILVRDAGFSIAQLLADTKLIQSQLEPLGLERPRDAKLRPRRAMPVVWVVPAAVFDDGDWPGGNPGMNDAALRAARRAEAGRWLVREGIAVVGTE